MQPDSVNLWYFKRKLFDLTEFIIWYIPDKTRERSFLLKELRLGPLKERTSFLSKPRLNVTISTRFSPHLIFCLGIKFTSPPCDPPRSFSRFWIEQLGATAWQLDSEIWTQKKARLFRRFLKHFLRRKRSPKTAYFSAF